MTEKLEAISARVMPFLSSSSKAKISPISLPRQCSIHLRSALQLYPYLTHSFACPTRLRYSYAWRSSREVSSDVFPSLCSLTRSLRPFASVSQNLQNIVKRTGHCIGILSNHRDRQVVDITQVAFSTCQSRKSCNMANRWSFEMVHRGITSVAKAAWRPLNRGSHWWRCVGCRCCAVECKGAQSCWRCAPVPLTRPALDLNFQPSTNFPETRSPSLRHSSILPPQR